MVKIEILDIVKGDMRRLTEEEKDMKISWSNIHGYKWVITRPYRCRVLFTKNNESHEKEIIVPVGFLTDGCTGGPDWGCSWVFHDFLYATHRFNAGEDCRRKDADTILKRVMDMEHLSFYSWAALLLARTNPFQIFSKAWQTSFERGAEILSGDV